MKRLYRSKRNQMICGVCGGLSDYLGVDATLIRLIWAIFALFAGSGVLFYVIAAVIMPKETDIY